MTATSSGYLCESTLTTTSNASGIIYSNKNGIYQDYMDCQWRLSSNANLKLVFFRFDTETRYDFVYVYDGSSNSSRQIGKYDGTTLPPTHTSSFNKLFVTFKADYSVLRNGFVAIYHGKARVIKNLRGYSSEFLVGVCRPVL